MKARSSFTVRAVPPPALSGLWEVAMNLRWTWDLGAQELFRTVDPQTWDDGPRDPILTLGRAGPRRLEELAADGEFMSRVEAVREAFARADSRELRDYGLVAYFSPEFGLAEAIPQYSGGLGVLAGDHLRAAADCGVPLVAVGLLYRHGYFRQELDEGGWQREHYPSLDPHGMALEPVEGAKVRIDMAGTQVSARVWRCRVGSVRLYLLDADVEENDPADRMITDRLYGGGVEHRLRQEILLGVGGVRALEAVGERPEVFHMNEGHAGFLSLERARRLVVDHGLIFDEACAAVRAGTVFTTHTSVPAGIDRFPLEILEPYLAEFAEDLGVSPLELLRLGQAPDDPLDAPFNMAALAFRMSGAANGVARLHGDVSRSLFSGLWPAVGPDEVPIGSVTNGVHGRAWVGPAIDELLVRAVGWDWPTAPAGSWNGLEDVDPQELWDVRTSGRAELVSFVRRRLTTAARARGRSAADSARYENVLDPDVLTVGFARRFAGYKRATLLLSQPERLKALLTNSGREVQLVFAGKAHPADDWGKEMIRAIVTFTRDPEVHHRVVFVEDYDINVARMLYRGADIWLNTPRRPHEACGTSGMKAALNGSLNCSVLDGWWDEMYDGRNGWAIPSAEAYRDDAVRDSVEADGLFELFERRIVPAFYDRGPDGIPHAFVERIRASLQSLGPRVAASRMIEDYSRDLYGPASERARTMAADGYARARAFAAWARRVRAEWDAVSLRVVDGVTGGVDAGTELKVRAEASLGGLTHDDVEIQLLYGTVDEHEIFAAPSIVRMEPAGDGIWEGIFPAERAGRFGFAVRAVPKHPDLTTVAQLGCVTWASGPATPV